MKNYECVYVKIQYKENKILKEEKDLAKESYQSRNDANNFWILTCS